MKYLIGTLVTLLLLFVFTYVVCRIWDIDLLSAANFYKILKTVGVIAIAAFLLTLAGAFFFRGQAAGYEKNARGISHPKITEK